MATRYDFGETTVYKIARKASQNARQRDANAKAMGTQDEVDARFDAIKAEISRLESLHEDDRLSDPADRACLCGVGMARALAQRHPLIHTVAFVLCGSPFSRRGSLGFVGGSQIAPLLEARRSLVERAAARRGCFSDDVVGDVGDVVPATAFVTQSQFAPGRVQSLKDYYDGYDPSAKPGGSRAFSVRVSLCYSTVGTASLPPALYKETSCVPGLFALEGATHSGNNVLVLALKDANNIKRVVEVQVSKRSAGDVFGSYTKEALDPFVQINADNYEDLLYTTIKYIPFVMGRVKGYTKAWGDLFQVFEAALVDAFGTPLVEPVAAALDTDDLKPAYCRQAEHLWFPKCTQNYSLRRRASPAIELDLNPRRRTCRWMSNSQCNRDGRPATSSALLQ